MGKLEELIASLSKNEKAYFKRWVPSTEKEKKFVAVFRYIEKKPTISTNELLKKLGDNVSPKKLETLKSHLWSSLLLSLRDYHRKNELQLQFNSRSDAIKVLRSKGQIDAALKDSKRLLKDCEEIEMFPEAVRAIEHIENIIALDASFDSETEESWNSLYAKKEQIGERISESSRVRRYERRLKLLNDRLGVTHSKAEHQSLVSELLKRINTEGISEDASVEVRFRFFQTQAIIARILNNRTDDRKWFEKVFKLLDKNPIITKTYYTTFYIVAFHNYVDALLFARELDEIPHLLNRMKVWLSQNPINVNRDFFFFANDTLAYHIVAESYQLGLNEWNQFEEQFRVEDSPSNHLLIRFMNLGAVICFWNGEYRRALSVLRLLFKQEFRQEEIELLDMAKMLEIICNYELGDLEHTEHLVGVSLRKEPENSMEANVIKTVEYQLRSSKESILQWSRLTENLQVLRKKPDEEDKLITFDMIKYSKSKEKVL